MKNKFSPIAMKCNQEQFEAVRLKLDKNTTFIKNIDDFVRFGYLTNYFRREENCVSNLSKSGCWYHENTHEIHETWNEKVFLESCGIEVEESFSITKEQIIEIYEYCNNSELKNSIKTGWFPKAFEEDKKELPKDFAGWCKIDNCGNDNWLMYFENGIQKYGFDSNNDWFVPAAKSFIIKYSREATEQEVFEALKKEAVKRGYDKENTCVKSIINKGHTVNLSNSGYEQTGYKFSAIGLLCNGVTIFKNGQWAEIIPTITIKEAEERLNCKIV